MTKSKTRKSKVKFFRKKGVQFNEGDRVTVTHETGKHSGILKDVLSSQIFVEDEEGTGRFYFYNGLVIEHDND